MPKGDRDIFKADCEDGYTRIANLILEALPLVRLTGVQYGICMFLWRRTYGWNRDQDAISLAEYAAACGSSRPYVSVQLADLIKKNMVYRISYTPGRTPVYAFNTRISLWADGCIDVEGLRGNETQGLYNHVTLGLSNRVTGGLYDRGTVNRVQTVADPGTEPAVKKELKKEKEREDFSSDSAEFRLAELLCLRIMEHLPSFKMPNLQKWSQSMDHILRVDKRPPEEVKAVILFAQKDAFWQNHILSVDKLRQKYDNLNLARINSRASPKTNGSAGKKGNGDTGAYLPFFT